MTTTIVSSATEITVIADGVVTKYDATQYKVTIEDGNVTAEKKAGERTPEQNCEVIDMILDQHLPAFITTLEKSMTFQILKQLHDISLFNKSAFFFFSLNFIFCDKLFSLLSLLMFDQTLNRTVC